MFYRYINGKLKKNAHEVQKLCQEGSTECSEDLRMVEVRSENFQAVLTRESDWNEENAQATLSPANTKSCSC